MTKSIETDNVHKLNLNEIRSNLQNRSGLSFRQKIALSTKDEIFAKKKKRSHFRGRFSNEIYFIQDHSIIFRIQSTYISLRSSDRTQIQYFLIMYINQLIHLIENNRILMYLR